MRLRFITLPGLACLLAVGLGPGCSTVSPSPPSPTPALTPFRLKPPELSSALLADRRSREYTQTMVEIGALLVEVPRASLEALDTPLDPATLRALPSADVLSAPRLLTRPGQVGTISILRERVYPGTYAPGNRSAVPINDFETAREGIELHVIASPDPTARTATPSQEIKKQALDVHCRLVMSELISMAEAEYMGAQIVQPLVAYRTLEETLTLNDGEPAELGRFQMLETVHVEDAVPMLSSIPLLGSVFRSSHTHVEARSVVVFITATRVEVE